MNPAVVFLDAGPLSEIVRRFGQSAEADRCRNRVLSLTAAGVLVCVSEITDYEVRRELMRSGKTTSLGRLDTLLENSLEYVPITTPTMREAAALWAAARNAGQPTASPEALDGDVLLCASVRLFTRSVGISLASAVVVTTNPAHIERFVVARRWDQLDVETAGG